MSSSSSTIPFHSLPIQTDFYGTTDVAENFSSHITRGSSDDLLHATLRGRSLEGREVRLPPDYAVALISIADASSSRSALSSTHAAAAAAAPLPAFVSAREQEQRVDLTETLSVQACASTYVQWEHDRPPAASATVPQWIALSSIIHSAK